VNLSLKEFLLISIDTKESSTLRYVVEFQPVVVIQTSGLAPGSIFPVGITTNTFVATDRSGNTTTQIFNVTVVDNTPPAISDLKASYYEGRNFETFMETKDVQELNYNWGTGAPESSLVGVNDFSVRFRGSIKAPQTGLYTFYTTSDDGVRLWVDGTSVVDNWTDHGRTVNTGTLNLIAGEYVPIILDYYENGGGAIIQLEWEGPGLTREYVKNQGLGSCLDLSLDLGSTGMRTITPAEIDPGYIDACGVSSRVLSKTEFTCNDSGDNPVTLTVTDVNGNQASCHVNIKIIGTPDNSLSVLGETLCEGNSADVIVKSSEVGVTYTLYIDSNQVSTSVIGTGVDISLNIPSSSLQVGTNLVIVRASRGACELNLQNTATVNINPKPKPKDISFD